ncbi:unnamed protein product [Rotaria sordida]|uniref:Uncharacterized protein n=1 Tax=Rotaria sordida TaxID=392033 RepID=A0A813ZUE0_9BILA|nr:unnamed protein product [Rotaria sordida]CAF0903233.1 unnamed protein product [Rotaria sordida]CAF3641301.1 unnamed protein product [Rotaria sordida]CAF4067883.1 unnamed protein product [Rotaria sordida]
MTCITMFVSLHTHHWIRNTDGNEHRGLKLACYDFGNLCHAMDHTKGGILFFSIITSLNFIFELSNIFFLCNRKRSRINLILEELAIVTTLIFVLAAMVFITIGFIVITSRTNEQFDWSFIVFLLSLMLGFIDLICSLVRVVSYCRDHSFRSTLITYNSNNNHETVQIQ